MRAAERGARVTGPASWSWTKRGLLIGSPPPGSWAVSHAALPIVDTRANGSGLRVYVSARDAQGRAQIGYVDWDPDSERVSPLSDRPVLAVGELGAFDDSGVTSSCLVTHQGAKYLYYTGWSRGVTVPFYLFAGVAISHDDGETFSRVSRAPLLERNDVDPFLTASPFVIVENGVWRMWYVSAAEWRASAGGPRHYYHIRYAESRNGVDWLRQGRVCIDFVHPDEHAIARPCVIRDGSTYRMWYSWRGERYRMGYAESADGIAWTRMDDVVGLDPSPSGWDSEMVEYPFVFNHGDRLLMLYNGNDYGKTGCGIAVNAGRPLGRP
jgi:hypothetical protein